MTTNTVDISFACPHCGKHLASPAQLAGKTFDCPDCLKPYTVPTSSDETLPGEQLSTPETAATPEPQSTSQPPDSSVEATDIRFACPHCEKHLAAPPELAGKTVNCPDCGKPFTVPQRAQPVIPTPAVAPPETTPESEPPLSPVSSARAIVLEPPPNGNSAEPTPRQPRMPARPPLLKRPTPKPPATSVQAHASDASPVPAGAEASAQHKACPSCGEQILVVAKKCKHCGELLAGAGSQHSAEATPTAIRRTPPPLLIAVAAVLVLAFVAGVFIVVSAASRTPRTTRNAQPSETRNKTPSPNNISQADTTTREDPSPHVPQPNATIADEQVSARTKEMQDLATRAEEATRTATALLSQSEIVFHSGSLPRAEIVARGHALMDAMKAKRDARVAWHSRVTADTKDGTVEHLEAASTEGIDMATYILDLKAVLNAVADAHTKEYADAEFRAADAGLAASGDSAKIENIGDAVVAKEKCKYVKIADLTAKKQFMEECKAIMEREQGVLLQRQQVLAREKSALERNPQR